eukprot:scaffold33900_cov73-Phaeocystis_antarctica.AAC.2
MSARPDQSVDHDTLKANVRQVEVGRRDARPLLKHSVGPELDQVPIENLRRLNRGRAVHPRAERAQDAGQYCSTAEALKCRFEQCMNDSAAPPSELREHWPAADGDESDDAGDQESAVNERKRQSEVAKTVGCLSGVMQRCWTKYGIVDCTRSNDRCPERERTHQEGDGLQDARAQHARPNQGGLARFLRW